MADISGIQSTFIFNINFRSFDAWLEAEELLNHCYFTRLPSAGLSERFPPPAVRVATAEVIERTVKMNLGHSVATAGCTTDPTLAVPLVPEQENELLVWRYVCHYSDVAAAAGLGPEHIRPCSCGASVTVLCPAQLHPAATLTGPHGRDTQSKTAMPLRVIYKGAHNGHTFGQVAPTLPLAPGVIAEVHNAVRLQMSDSLIHAIWVDVLNELVASTDLQLDGRVVPALADIARVRLATSRTLRERRTAAICAQPGHGPTLSPEEQAELEEGILPEVEFGPELPADPEMAECAILMRARIADMLNNMLSSATTTRDWAARTLAPAEFAPPPVRGGSKIPTLINAAVSGVLPKAAAPAPFVPVTAAGIKPELTGLYTPPQPPQPAVAPPAAPSPAPARPRGRGRPRLSHTGAASSSVASSSMASDTDYDGSTGGAGLADGDGVSTLPFTTLATAPALGLGGDVLATSYLVHWEVLTDHLNMLLTELGLLTYELTPSARDELLSYQPSNRYTQIDQIHLDNNGFVTPWVLDTVFDLYSSVLELTKLTARSAPPGYFTKVQTLGTRIQESMTLITSHAVAPENIRELLIECTTSAQALCKIGTEVCSSADHREPAVHVPLNDHCDSAPLARRAGAEPPVARTQPGPDEGWLRAALRVFDVVAAAGEMSFMTAETGLWAAGQRVRRGLAAPSSVPISNDAGMYTTIGTALVAPVTFNAPASDPVPRSLVPVEPSALMTLVLGGAMTRLLTTFPHGLVNLRISELLATAWDLATTESPIIHNSALLPVSAASRLVPHPSVAATCQHIEQNLSASWPTRTASLTIPTCPADLPEVVAATVRRRRRRPAAAAPLTVAPPAMAGVVWEEHPWMPPRFVSAATLFGSFDVLSVQLRAHEVQNAGSSMEVQAVVAELAHPAAYTTVGAPVSVKSDYRLVPQRILPAAEQINDLTLAATLIARLMSKPPPIPRPSGPAAMPEPVLSKDQMQYIIKMLATQTTQEGAGGLPTAEIGGAGLGGRQGGLLPAPSAYQIFGSTPATAGLAMSIAQPAVSALPSAMPFLSGMGLPSGLPSGLGSALPSGRFFSVLPSGQY